MFFEILPFVKEFIKGDREKITKNRYFVNFDAVNLNNERNDLVYHVGNFLKNIINFFFPRKMDF